MRARAPHLMTAASVRALLAHAHVANTSFARGAFTFGGVRRQGLTRRIGARMRVARHRRAACAACVRARATSGGPSARQARAHGVRVDRELTAYVEAARAPVDARTRYDSVTLCVIEYLERVRGWRLAATQVPLYIEALDVATAIDVVCVDRDGRLHLVEVKATLDGGLARACYEAPPPAAATRSSVARGALASLERTRAASHQLQLWAMHHALVAECALDVASALIVRADEHGVAAYPLNAWMLERSTALVAFLGRRRRAAKQRSRPRLAK